jgi:hypothetical protein
MARDVSGQLEPVTPAGWLARAGWSGKLFMAGGLIGLIAAFLPLASFSKEIKDPGAMVRFNQTLMVVDVWRGKVSLIGYLAALAFAWLLYPPKRSPAKPMTWTAAGVGGVVLLLGIWLLIDILRARGGGDMIGWMGSVNLTMGIGSFVNFVAAGAVAIAAALKGREEGLF